MLSAILSYQGYILSKRLITVANVDFITWLRQTWSGFFTLKLTFPSSSILSSLEGSCFVQWPLKE